MLKELGKVVSKGIAVVKKNKAVKKQGVQSLIAKTTKLKKDLKWVDEDFEIEKICLFLNTFEAYWSSLSPEEWGAAPRSLKELRSKTSRGDNGWFRAKEGESADITNVFVIPHRHFEANHGEIILSKLMTLDQEKTNQNGSAKGPMTTKNFYFLTFVAPFIWNSYKGLDSIISEIK